MSLQMSKELLQAFNNIADLQSKIYKIDAAIFMRNSDKIIKEKVQYLNQIIQNAAKSYKQNELNYYDEINLILGHYKQKLNMVYDEFYCQYANIQNEIQEARLNKQIAISNYQKTVNNNERNVNEDYSNIKSKLKETNDLYNKIINMCCEKFESCKSKFEKKINEEFFVVTVGLPATNKTGFIQTIKSKLTMLFNGKKMYSEVLSNYSKSVDNIDSQEIVKEMREDTIDFVVQIMELKGFSDFESDEDVG